MADQRIIIKAILGTIAILGAIATITMSFISLRGNQHHDSGSESRDTSDDPRFKEGGVCAANSIKDAVTANWCNSLKCKFDMSQCTEDCPFGYTVDSSLCPTSCKCAGAGVHMSDVMYSEKEVPSMLKTFGYVDESEVVSVFSGNALVEFKGGMNALWPKDDDGTVTIPFYYEDDEPFMWSNVEEGLEWFDDNTCIRFVEEDEATCRSGDLPTACLFISNGPGGCSSRLGHDGGTRQRVSLEVSQSCDNVFAVIHELMHALGISHEMIRPDRDDHIFVMKSYVQERGWNNYIKKKYNMVYDMGIPYDIWSIMQYNSQTFAKPGVPYAMIDLKQPSKAIQPRVKATDYDMQEVNMLYKCEDFVDDEELVIGTEPPDSFTTAMTKLDKPFSEGNGWMPWGPWGRQMNQKKVRWRGCKTYQAGEQHCWEPLFFEVQDADENEHGYIGGDNHEKFGEWSEWGPCVKRSGPLCMGLQMRTRDFIPGSAKDGGGFQMQNAVEVAQCLIVPCSFDVRRKPIPVPMYTSWNRWWPVGECSKTCGTGTQKFRRECHDQDGRIVEDCDPPGTKEEFKDDECNVFECPRTSSRLPPGMSSPINDETYGWAEWGSWSECENGEQIKYRTCKGVGHGVKCRGRSYASQKCLTAREQADLQYTSWGEWGNCLLLKTGSCAGAKYRYRSCLKEGECDAKGTTEMKACYRCSHGEIKWTPWRNSECSATCQGSMRRKRDCIDSSTKKASSKCVGTKEETVPCNTQSCDSKPKRLPTVFAVESTKTKTTPCKDETSKWVFGHFTGDKKVEAICTGTSGNLQLMGLIGDKNLGSTLWTGRLYECMGDDVIKYAADINGDQVDDLICKRETSGLYHIHLMMYDKFSAVPDYSTTLCGEDETPTFLNLNGDLRNDALCWNKQSGKMNIFINQITG